MVQRSVPFRPCGDASRRRCIVGLAPVERPTVAVCALPRRSIRSLMACPAPRRHFRRRESLGRRWLVAVSSAGLAPSRRCRRRPADRRPRPPRARPVLHADHQPTPTTPPDHAADPDGPGPATPATTAPPASPTTGRAVGTHRRSGHHRRRRRRRRSPADPGAIVAAVQADLDQLQAIARWPRSASRGRAEANVAPTPPRRRPPWPDPGPTPSRRRRGRHHPVHGATGKLSSIAVAAYTGAAYATPEAAPTQPPGSPGTVDLARARCRTDANELISLIADQEKHHLTHGQEGGQRTAAGVAGPGGRQTVAAAQARSAAATAKLSGGQRRLVDPHRAGRPTVAGAAASHTAPAGAAHHRSGTPAASTPAAAGG